MAFITRRVCFPGPSLLSRLQSCIPSQTKVRRILYAKKESLEHTRNIRLITSVIASMVLCPYRGKLECAVMWFCDHSAKSLGSASTSSATCSKWPPVTGHVVCQCVSASHRVCTSASAARLSGQQPLHGHVVTLKRPLPLNGDASQIVSHLCRPPTPLVWNPPLKLLKYDCHHCPPPSSCITCKWTEGAQSDEREDYIATVCTCKWTEGARLM